MRGCRGTFIVVHETPHSFSAAHFATVSGLVDFPGERVGGSSTFVSDDVVRVHARNVALLNMDETRDWLRPGVFELHYWTLL